MSISRHIDFNSFPDLHELYIITWFYRTLPAGSTKHAHAHQLLPNSGFRLFQNVWTEKAASSNSKTRYGKIQRSLLNRFKFSPCFDVLSSGHVQVVRALFNYTAQQVRKYSDPSSLFRSIAVASFVYNLQHKHRHDIGFVLTCLYVLFILFFCSQTRSVLKKAIFCT